VPDEEDYPMLTHQAASEEWRPFRCDVEPEHGRVRVTPHGELDLATVPDVERRLRELRESAFDRIVFDMRELVFMDSTGLRLVMREHAAAAADGREFVLVPGAPAVQRIFEVACVSDQLTFTDG
jgi:anti-anti-sigma factor